MTNKIITIGRQFGSNGREIGRQLAEKLGIPFYDKELLQEAAKASGLSENILKNLDEKPNKSFLYNLVMDPYNYGYSSTGYHTNLNQQAFQATYDTVKKLAEQGPCVIVGRCADYALRHNDKLFRAFIFAPFDSRVKTISSRFDIDEEKAKALITKEDKGRASYYNYYTSKKWGSIDSYDFFVNSSLLPIEQTVDYMISYIESIN
ncbi:MAG: cytidylate kinase-like family protein [Eubacteriales bacterium]|nr:cytidylate kinase-like family protein [Lachnospiraceae bacterium]MDO5127189.1 cytidylate kinase-like family protein [Eubacteriales bacterium]